MSSTNPGAPTQCNKLNANAYLAQAITDNLEIASMIAQGQTSESVFASTLAAVEVNQDAVAIEEKLREDAMLAEEATPEQVVEVIEATITLATPIIEDDWSCCLDPLTGRWYPWSPTKGWSRGTRCAAG